MQKKKPETISDNLLKTEKIKSRQPGLVVLKLLRQVV